ncbi:MAG: DUF2860 family protein [Halioglobus sp.]|nr:DUF2860 family protein [Halioglobus sp.]
MKKMLPALALSLATSSALALGPMPKEAGFSGEVQLGAAGGPVKTNFLAEAVTIDLSNDKIYDYTSPTETTIIVPSLQFEVGYTFSGGNTRVRLANGAVENSLDFSFNTLLGLRHDFDSLGNIEIAALLPTPGVKVWQDPYLLDQKRRSTDRDSTGAHLAWDRIFGSGLEFVGSFRKRDIENERSGNSIGILSPSQRDLLDRQGDLYRYELGYMVDVGAIKVRPSVAWIDRDLDGGAMAQDGFEIGIGLLYQGSGYSWLNRVAYQDLDGDRENPIFVGKTNDAEVYVFASELRIPEPFGWDNWFTAVGLAWGENQADIKFNKSSAAIFAARLGRRV